MHLLDNIEDNSILIIPNNIRDKILKYLNDNKILKNIKIQTFNDIKKSLLYDYTNEAIYSIMKYKNISYDIAKDYINNTYYLTENNYSNDKLKNILDIKNYLNNNNLLIKDKLFINLLKSKSKIYIFGFTYINSFNNYLLDILKKYVPVQILENKINDYKHEVYEFNTMSEEIEYVAEKIAKLISKGIDINKIYIANYSDSYYFTLNRIFNSYHIPYHIKNETSLYDTHMGNYFINNLIDDKDKLLYNIREKFDIEHNEYNNKVYNKILNLLNTYYWAPFLTKIKDLIIEETHNIKIPTTHYSKEIKTTNILDNIFNDDEYVFLIGFNLVDIPKVKKDEDYIDDSIKTSIQETSKEYNSNQKNNIIKSIKNIKNLIITYKLSDTSNSYEPSYLIDDNYLKIKHINYSPSIYNDELNTLNLADEIDNLIKFNEINENISILNNTYDIPYNTYDNSFTGIDSNELLNLINDRLTFSYSNIKKYYECPFKFYISSILKIGNYEQNFNAIEGSLVHKVLEECIRDENDIDKVFNDELNYLLDKNNIELTNSEKFFIKLINEETHFIVETIKEQYTHSKHNPKNELHEKEIIINIDRKIKTKLKGFVDKILVIDNKAIIIDYKTGHESIDIETLPFGMDLQLPIYLYLLSIYDENLEVIGLYIQHVLDLNITKDNKEEKSLIDQKKERLKLDGITFNDMSSISLFDDTYESSQIIKSLKINKDGSVKKNKNILPIDKRDKLKELVQEKIYTCIDNVTDGNFKINPLKIDKKVDGCSNCEYKDVCYRKYKDFNIQEIKKKEDESNA